MSMLIPNLEELVPADNFYRKLLEIVDFEELSRPFSKLYSQLGRAGYPICSGFKCLFIQFYEDLSDRELERHLKDSLSAKLFCGFELTEKTPDFTYFYTLRKRIGTSRLSKLFNSIRESMKKAGYIKEIFSFVDATTIHSKVNLWEARDKALADRENNEKDDNNNPKMNNNNVGNYSSDPDARFGCKGNKNFWFGYKMHACVDMSSGIINKVAVTPANVTDAKGLKYVCPNGGMVPSDKGYCTKEAQRILKINGCHSGAILKNNMQGKNFDKDNWLTSLRMPYEGTFSKINKKARYRGLVKNQFQAIMQALVHNFKRLVKIEAEPIPIYSF